MRDTEETQRPVACQAVGESLATASRKGFNKLIEPPPVLAPESIDLLLSEWAGPDQGRHCVILGLDHVSIGHTRRLAHRTCS